MKIQMILCECIVHNICQTATHTQRHTHTHGEFRKNGRKRGVFAGESFGCRKGVGTLDIRVRCSRVFEYNCCGFLWAYSLGKYILGAVIDKRRQRVNSVSVLFYFFRLGFVCSSKFWSSGWSGNIIS
jgi:hypothetical protein